MDAVYGGHPGLRAGGGGSRRPRTDSDDRQRRGDRLSGWDFRNSIKRMESMMGAGLTSFSRTRSSRQARALARHWWASWRARSSNRSPNACRAIFWVDLVVDFIIRISPFPELILRPAGGDRANGFTSPNLKHRLIHLISAPVAQ